MRRKLGYALLAVGICLLAWVGATLYWGDPVTSLYTSYEQRGLSQRLDSLQHVWAAQAQRNAAIRSSDQVASNADGGSPCRGGGVRVRAPRGPADRADHRSRGSG